MKKYLSFCLAVLLVFSVSTSAFAFAIKEPPIELQGKQIDVSAYTYYEDFSSVELNQKPASFGGTSEPENCAIYVVKGSNEDNEKKNLLKLSDENASGNVYFDIPVNQKSSKVLFETKFKFVKTTDEYMSFNFNMYGANTTYIARVLQWSQGGVMCAYSDQGINNDITPAAPVSDVWYTLQILVDKESGTFDVQVQSEALKGHATIKKASRYDPVNGVVMLKGLDVYNETAGMPVQKIRVSSTNKRGEMYFEYLRVSESFNEIEYKGIRPEPLKLPIKESIIFNSIVKDTVNVKLNDNYMYFVNKPVVENNTVYTSLRETASAFNFKLTYKDGVYTLNKTGVVAEISNNKITVNGTELKIDKPVIIKNNIYYIPVVEFANAIGNKAIYDGDVVIK